MRDRREIEREMYRARQDLDTSLGQLKHVVREKIAIKARAQHAVQERVDRAKDRARALYYRGRFNVGRAYDQGRDKVIERPYLSAAILGGVLLATVGAIFLIHRHNRRIALT